MMELVKRENVVYLWCFLPSPGDLSQGRPATEVLLQWEGT